MFFRRMLPCHKDEFSFLDVTLSKCQLLRAALNDLKYVLLSGCIVGCLERFKVSYIERLHLCVQCGGTVSNVIPWLLAYSIGSNRFLPE